MKREYTFNDGSRLVVEVEPSPAHQPETAAAQLAQLIAAMAARLSRKRRH